MKNEPYVEQFGGPVFIAPLASPGMNIHGDVASRDTTTAWVLLNPLNNKSLGPYDSIPFLSDKKSENKSSGMGVSHSSPALQVVPAWTAMWQV